MNTELTQQIFEYLREEPKRMDMEVWHVQDCNDCMPKTEIPSCGTVCCFAGTAILLKAKEHNLSYYEFILQYSQQNSSSAFDVMNEVEIGARLLDIPEDDALSLFVTDHWPEPFQHQYRVLKNLYRGVKSDIMETSGFPRDVEANLISKIHNRFQLRKISLLENVVHKYIQDHQDPTQIATLQIANGN